MREIKFRIYDDITPKPRMIYHNDLFSLTLDGKLIYGNADFTKEFTLMQFTGLKDKNGVEIYEGDIVEFIAYGREELERAVIQCYGSSFYLQNFSGYSDEYLRNATDIEIIGNIYENGDLLNA